MVMSANVGVALMLVARPATFADPGMSRRVRDAVHASVLTHEAMYGGPDTGGTDGTSADGTAASGPDDGSGTAPAVAARLGALLRQSPPEVLSGAEGALLTEWLERVSDARAAEPSS